MLWIALFIVGLLALLAGMVPLLLNGLSRTNFTAVAFGTVLLVAGIAGVVIHPSLPLTIADITALETPATGSEPPSPQPAPNDSTEAGLPAPGPAVRVIEPETDAGTAPSPSAKDESQLEPTSLPDPLAVATTEVPGGEPDPLAPPTPVPSPAAAARSEDSIAALALASQQTKEQAAFSTAIAAAKTEFDAAAVAEREAIQPQRAAAICQALPKPEVKGWVGTIQASEKDSGGRLTVTVTLPDGTLVKTWNNAMSDMEDQTLVAAGTPLAQSFDKLKAGDAIRFAGTFFADEMDCYRSSRLALSQSMLEPSFLFRFTAVEKL